MEATQLIVTRRLLFMVPTGILTTQAHASMVTWPQIRNDESIPRGQPGRQFLTFGLSLT